MAAFAADDTGARGGFFAGGGVASDTGSASWSGIVGVGVGTGGPGRPLGWIGGTQSCGAGIVGHHDRYWRGRIAVVKNSAGFAGTGTEHVAGGSRPDVERFVIGGVAIDFLIVGAAVG